MTGNIKGVGNQFRKINIHITSDKGELIIQREG